MASDQHSEQVKLIRHAIESAMIGTGGQLLAEQALDNLLEQLQAAQDDHEATSDRLRKRRDENVALQEQLEAEKTWGRNQADLVTEMATELDSLKEQLEALREALVTIRDGGYQHYVDKKANPWARAVATDALAAVSNPAKSPREIEGSWELERDPASEPNTFHGTGKVWTAPVPNQESRSE